MHKGKARTRPAVFSTLIKQVKNNEKGVWGQGWEEGIQICKCAVLGREDQWKVEVHAHVFDPQRLSKGDTMTVDCVREGPGPRSS